MQKTERSELVEDFQNELTSYLREGKINYRELTYDLTDLDPDNLQDLKRAHFILWEDVVKFAEGLESDLRNMNTVTTNRETKTRGEIKGQINWSKTVKTRYSKDYGNNSVFICRNPEIEYDTPENLVLKKLLGIIYSTISEFDSLSAKSEGDQVEGWTEDLAKKFRRVYNMNVHLDEIKEFNKINLTGRELQAARNSRKDIYQEAYRLYRSYQKMEENRFGDEVVQEIIDNTLIEPQYTHRLFELYSIFALIENKMSSEDLELRHIESSGREEKPLAILDNEEKIVEVYHDTVHSFDFTENPDRNIEELEGRGNSSLKEFVKRFLEVIDEHEEIMKDFLDYNVSDSLYGGVPDILMVEKDRESKNIQKLTIGEVKYRNKKADVSKGMKELIEYLKFGKKAQGEYFEDSDFSLEGILVTDQVEEIDEVKEKRNIQWFTSETLET